jgi:hypothetical protein
MKDQQQKMAIDNVSVTAPIKNIMQCVDALEESYERRLAAMTAEYKADVEAVVECYKQEKQQFLIQSEQQALILEQINPKLADAERRLKQEIVEHKITKDCLATVRQELDSLKDKFKTEEEYIMLTEQKIQLATEQLKLEEDLVALAKHIDISNHEQIQHRLEAAPESKRRNFFMRIFAKRANKILNRNDDIRNRTEDETKKNEPFSF